MPDLIVATSTVADGSMKNRHDEHDPEVIQNRRIFLKKLGIAIEQATRVGVDYSGNDFCRYVEVSNDHAGAGMQGTPAIISDALITTTPGHALVLPVADCVATTLYDPEHRVLMLAHLGRHSLEQQGGQRVVEYLQKHFATNPRQLRVWLTPAPNQAAYPIWALDNQGMKETTLEQLQNAGVQLQHIENNGADTVTDKNYFSYSEFLKGNREIDGDHMMVAMMTK